MNRYTLITGASRGIGKAIALNFATKGINLILVSSKSNEALAETMQEVLSYGVCCMAFSTDVSDYSQILDLKSKLADSDITIDCVVNNAGIDYFGIIQDMSVDDWHHIIDVNLSSIFYTSKAFIPDMLGLDRGCIIQMGVPVKLHILHQKGELMVLPVLLLRSLPLPTLVSMLLHVVQSIHL